MLMGLASTPGAVRGQELTFVIPAKAGTQRDSEQKTYSLR
jgi:hypothetical protein